MDKKLKKFLNWYKKKKDDEAFITPKDAYKRAWTCRDFELSHLWQRSVFLAVFLIAIAGAYGTLLMNMYFHSDQNYVYEWENSGTLEKSMATKITEYEAKSVTYQQHAIAVGVCWLGIAFSILWVMMAKGSKYWFERYEMTIWNFENEMACGDKIIDFPHHGKLPTLKPEKYNDNIFSSKAGHYSVSKVNATIGIIALIAFSFLAMFHFEKFLYARLKLSDLQCAVFSVAHWLFFGAILLATLCFLCRSGHKDEDK